MEKKDLSASDEEQEEIVEDDMDSNQSDEEKERLRSEELMNQQLNTLSQNHESSMTPSPEEMKRQKQEEEDETQENREDNEDAENESDKTQENDEDQYKKAQSKKMYIIQEVDEDALSEQSSALHEKHLLLQQQRLESSMHQEPQLEPLVEDVDEEKKEEEEFNKNILVNNTFQDASQDIEPSQINLSIEGKVQ